MGSCKLFDDVYQKTLAYNFKHSLVDNEYTNKGKDGAEDSSDKYKT